MPDVDFFRTVMGHRFYEGDVPAIRDALKTIARELPALTAALVAARPPQIVVQPDESHWDEDPRFPVADWKYEVANDDTRQSYREWVKAKTELDVDCALCGKLTSGRTAHLHQGKWIGECCWDERLRASE